jgi:putative sugar O-methyltransferase
VLLSCRSYSKILSLADIPNNLQSIKQTLLSDASRLRERLADIIRPAVARGSNGCGRLPEGVAHHLRHDNPYLTQLKHRYLGHPATRHSLWSEGYLRELELAYFRGDNAYIYQQRYASDAAYALTAQYVLANDALGLLTRLNDDDLFGNYVVDFDGILSVSRELLDSVMEINFLESKLHLSNLASPVVLDIGAGYGRLAHRLVQAIPQLRKVLCTDAVAESTFVSEFYLKFRGVQDKALAVPLDEIEQKLREHQVDVAVNVHSFGECRFESIIWWLDLIKKNRIQYLFIVANGEGLGSTESDKTNIDYLAAILARGYKLAVRQEKYFGAPSVQKYGLYPTYYYLFERD